ncbi:hypothetical protein [Nitrosospira sp. Nsp13]|uniref:hypothetical protein n=1 Tax=Nitrosospira sp. Nsp13 TaxID=1855332 RepID=UPI0008881D60|nr:hypothetical protein [Nitrosospira sp. Nsp13]SCX87731.1 hypothetical protein SAMN05216308_101682 [Nitrosospira sp. Nsp13]
MKQKNKSWLAVFFGGFLSLMFLNVALAQGSCSCGPDFCLNDPRYSEKLLHKKSSLKNLGYPDDLVSLLDKDGACVACVERAPDGFSIREVGGDGSMRTSAWSAAAEKAARDALIQGKLRVYYKFNVARRFSCCGERRYDELPDWNATHDVNTDMVITCTLSGSSAICI